MPWAQRSAWRSGRFNPGQRDPGANEIESYVDHEDFMDACEGSKPCWAPGHYLHSLITMLTE